MNAHDRLLLSEGVCSQLSIVEYYDNVWPGCEFAAVVEDVSVPVAAKAPLVKTFHVDLMRSVAIPANEAVSVSVHFGEGELPTKALLFEGHDYGPAVTTTIEC